MPEDIESYNAAFYGSLDVSGAGGQDVISVIESENAGCYGKGYIKFPPINPPGLKGKERYVKHMKGMANDPESISAESKWSVCMNQSGYSYTSRVQMMRSMSKEFDQPTKEHEIATEKILNASDVCRKSTGYDNSIALVKSRFNAEFAQQNRSELEGSLARLRMIERKLIREGFMKPRKD